MTSSTATFETVAAEATEILAGFGPFIDPGEARATKAMFDAIPAWCHAVLGRVPDNHPRFGHPVITNAEMALLLAAARLGYEPDTDDPDVPVIERP